MEDIKILDKVFKRCTVGVFPTFENRHVYDIKYKNIASSEEFILTITNGYICLIVSNLNSELKKQIN